MTFLAINEVWDWCRRHGIGLDADRRLPRLAAGPDNVFFEFGDGQAVDHQEAVRVGKRCLDSIVPWDECLLWVTDWGVWPSSEDWPAYYAARGSRGERRSLQDAPGHLFDISQLSEMEDFLTFVIEHGWDAELLTASNGTASRRLFISHDGWVQNA